MAAAIDSVFMVEASPDLREAQKALLCGPDAPCTESRVGRHSTGKRLGAPIVWTETIKSIPIGGYGLVFLSARQIANSSRPRSQRPIRCP